MTYEEAKMQIQAIPEKIWDQLSEPDKEAMEMAFSALEKQIPKEPEKYDEVLWELYCPSCENRIGMWSNSIKQYSNICPYCGQAIDLEEGE